jgi:hypothetical protein
MGDKLFALPWKVLHVEPDRDRVVVSVSKELLEKAEGFNKNDWPIGFELSIAQHLALYAFHHKINDAEVDPPKNHEDGDDVFNSG